MIGSIIGDFVGSYYEGKGIKGYSLELITPNSKFTDETVLMAATSEVLLNYEVSEIESSDFAKAYKNYGLKYPDCGYGPDFEFWLNSEGLEPYGSSGAGSSSRVMPIGFLPLPESVLMGLAELSSSATHDSPDAIRCAQAVVFAIHHCLKGANPEDVVKNIEGKFYLPLRFDWDDLHKNYEFSSYCESIIPEAIFIGLKARSFEDAMRKGLYIGGDTDTILSIAGAIAQARGLSPNKELKFRVKKILSERYSNLDSVFNDFAESVGR